MDKSGRDYSGNMENPYGLRTEPFRNFLIVPFIQRYADDPELLWVIGKRLKVALAIRFTRSDSVGTAREFIRTAKKEQRIAKACNCIAVGNWLTPVPPHRSPHAR